jgi:hypothetical protein
MSRCFRIRLQLYVPCLLNSPGDGVPRQGSAFRPAQSRLQLVQVREANEGRVNIRVAQREANAKLEGAFEPHLFNQWKESSRPLHVISIRASSHASAIARWPSQWRAIAAGNQGSSCDSPHCHHAHVMLSRQPDCTVEVLPTA